MTLLPNQLPLATSQQQGAITIADRAKLDLLPIVSQAEPSSPTEGMLWREIDSNGRTVGRWERRTTPAGERWISDTVWSNSGVVTNTGSAVPVSNGTPMTNAQGEVLLEAVQISMMVANATGHSSSVYHRFEFGVFTGQNSGTVDWVFETQSFTTINTPYLVRQSMNLVYERPNAFRVGISGFGSPGNYRASFALFTRQVR